ncbi:MAG: AAA family ATPase [Minicystis sp.]
MSQSSPRADSPPYAPTRIRRLYVRGYRSIKELDLVDLPSIVVLHGENGAGKSNILRAMALPLRWLASDGPIAGTRQSSMRLEYVTADAQLGIRRDDFNGSAAHEMQFRIEVEIGSLARLSVPGLPEDAVLAIDIVVQDVGDGIRWWAVCAQIGEELSLTSPEAVQGTSIREAMAQALGGLAGVQGNLRTYRDRLSNPSVVGGERATLVGQIAVFEGQARSYRATVDLHEKSLDGKLLTLDRVRSKLLRRELFRMSEAYRRIFREPMGNTSDFEGDVESLGAPEQIQRRLYLLATSSETRERAVLQSLSKRLSDVMGDHDGDAVSIELSAVRNNEFREYETQISRGNLEGVPLTSLGTGEQQLFILLLDVLVAATPIVQIEEPEAHLHKKLMLRLAKLLEKLVEEHDVDQLFLATHHHAFAIAPQYYDVTYDDEHGTRAVLTNRARAIEHLYEPGPLWEALRSLVASGLRDDAVIFRDEAGEPMRAREILASIQDEGPLAKKFAEELTKTILLSMREEAENDET